MAEKKLILLADDDDFFRGALKKLLMSQGHDVIEASDGKGAQHILGMGKFDLVISDIRMPVMDGIGLLTWAKANTTTPVILITGFSEILETAEAHRLGAADFLLKPFRPEDIASAIERATGKALPAGAEPDVDSQYCKIPLEDFVTGSRINFNISLRISATKYVRIAYKGEDISVDRIRAYRSKGVQYVYVNREDFAKYVGFSLELARKVRDSKTLSEEKKRNFLRYTGEVVLEEIYLKDLKRDTFAYAKDFTETALGILAESDAAVAILEAMNAHADFLYAHSVAVSLYSVIVARSLGWQSTPNLFKVSLGGLLHDIGLKEVDRAILEKPRTSHSQDERQLYESHPVRGMELLNQLPILPSDAILIAYQHHEDCIGFGYPKKLSKTKIHPMARIIAVVDLFCEYAIKGPGWDGLPGQEAIKRVSLSVGTRLDPEPLAALAKAFDCAPGKGVAS